MHTLDARGAGDAADARVQNQDRSTNREGEGASTPIRHKRAPVLPPGYPLRTFVLHAPEDVAEADSVAACHPGRPEDDRRRGWRAGLPRLPRVPAAVARSGSMGGWDPVRRRHRSWSLYSCLALLLLTQMGVASLLALHSRPGLDAQEGQAAFTTRSLAESPLDAAAAEVRRAAPEQTPAPAAAASSPADAPLLTGATYNTVGQPCHSTTFFVARVTQWAVPPGCFAKIYRPSPTSYPAMPGAFGQCSWWVEVLHAQNRDIIWNRTYPRGSTPIPGAVISFSPYVQGASGDGHYAQVVAVQPGSPWILVTEMNFTWRGGGFGKVDYRYVKVEPGMTFIYSGPWMLASQADRDNLD